MTLVLRQPHSNQERLLTLLACLKEEAETERLRALVVLLFVGKPQEINQR